MIDQLAESNASEVNDLKSCIGNLIGILALPALTTGSSEPRLIIDTLLDALVRILRPDYVYVVLKNPALEMVRGTADRFKGDCVAAFPLGLRDELGVLVAGSRRAGFPSETERLLLNVAANQAAIALQEARQMAELGSIVAERTEALRLSQAQLSHAMQIAANSEITAAIAHEINQPLAAVVSNAQAALHWLSTDSPDLAKVRESIEDIVRDGTDAGEVVRRVRRLFKGTSLESTAFEINNVIGDVLRVMHDEFERCGAVVQTTLDAGLPTVQGDRIQLQQLLMNLLNNALEAMESTARSKAIGIRSTRVENESIRVDVSDTGPGVDDPQRVFDAFFTTKESGLGMGLAICRSIVESHRGRLWLSSSTPLGATFSFTLPGSES